MKLVKCNHCKDEYYICEELDKLGFPIGTGKCGMCESTDYTVIDDDVKLDYSAYKDVDNLDTVTEDMRHSMAMFKDELNELIETYINPWLK